MKQRLWVLWISSEGPRATCWNFNASCLTYWRDWVTTVWCWFKEKRSSCPMTALALFILVLLQSASTTWIRQKQSVFRSYRGGPSMAAPAPPKQARVKSGPLHPHPHARSMTSGLLYNDNTNSSLSLCQLTNIWEISSGAKQIIDWNRKHLERTRLCLHTQSSSIHVVPCRW
jgi:hypothetical protein